MTVFCFFNRFVRDFWVGGGMQGSGATLDTTAFASPILRRKRASPSSGSARNC